ncbi:Fc.00g105050.m01.CDS01 [Cosmosporella sp. VM-42]
MDSAAAIRRRRRRRVAEENRRRAPRACERCKVRKSKCIESTVGKCQRCLKNNLTCRFERENSPQQDMRVIEAAAPDRAPVAVTGNAMSPEETISIDSHQTVGIILRPTRLRLAESSRLREAIDAFPPRPVADFLLSVCISHGADGFFYFDQAQFLAEIDEFYTNPTSPLRGESGFVCLALAALALGSQWATLERPKDSARGLRPEDVDPGHIFLKHARTLIPDMMDGSCLRSIQAPFILGVYLLPASAIGSSYVYLGLALHKALAFDLHQNTDDLNFGEREREVRRRLWWAIFSLERATTVKLNRPRSIEANIITTPLPLPLASLDRLQKFENVLHQIANAQLILILDRIADLGTLPSNTLLTEKAEADLKAWKQSLPSTLKIENLQLRDQGYRAALHLHLNYYYAWIAMGKVSLVTVVRAHLQYHFRQEREPFLIDKTVERLSQSCIKAGRKLLQLFEDLARNRFITRFSFTDFQGCSIATIVTLLAGILCRDSGYESRVAFGLECLRRMSGGNMTAKMGVRFVEALQSIANEAAQKLSRLTPETVASTVGGTSNSNVEYNEWAS